MNQISFWVDGIPAPGGSKSAFPIRRNGQLVTKNGRPVIAMVDAGGKRNKAWRAAVAEAGKARFAELGMPAIEGAVELHCRFFMPRPQTHYRAKQQLRPDAPVYHLIAPDATKLTRSTEDALAGIAWLNDSQVVNQVISKTFADPSRRVFTGCIVTIIPLT